MRQFINKLKTRFYPDRPVLMAYGVIMSSYTHYCFYDMLKTNHMKQKKN